MKIEITIQYGFRLGDEGKDQKVTVKGTSTTNDNGELLVHDGTGYVAGFAAGQWVSWQKLSE